MNAFVTYKVTTKTTLPRFDSQNFSVYRRYSDFEWLQEQLSDEFPGLIIPPLPEKHVIRRFAEPFLSQRQRLLEKFLNRIASHTSLREHMYVKSFLEEVNLDGMKEAVAKQGKTTAGSFWQIVSDATNSFSSKVVGGYTYDRPKTEEDIKFDQAKHYINSLDPQIHALNKHTHGLVEQGRSMAQALFDFGLAFTLLGQAEADALGDAMAQLGQCADKLSRITAVEADKEAQFFDEPIKEYVKLVKQVKLALDARQTKATAYENLMGALASKQDQKARLPSGDSRGPSLDDEIRQTKSQLEEAKRQFELVTERVLDEMDRFKREKLVDFKRIVLDYVQLQIEYNQKVEESWRTLLPALKALNIQQASPEPSVSESTPVVQGTKTVNELDAAFNTDGNSDEEANVPTNGEEEAFV